MYRQVASNSNPLTRFVYDIVTVNFMVFSWCFYWTIYVSKCIWYLYTQCFILSFRV